MIMIVVRCDWKCIAEGSSMQHCFYQPSNYENLGLLMTDANNSILIILRCFHDNLNNLRQSSNPDIA